MARVAAVALLLAAVVAGCATPQYAQPTPSNDTSYHRPEYQGQSTRGRLPSSRRSDARRKNGNTGGVGRRKVPEPARVAKEPASPVVDLRAALEGCVIVAEDGQMLGLITANAYSTNSFLNKFGPYGSKFSSTSIWNQFGEYGNPYSSMSPFNPYTSVV